MRYLGIVPFLASTAALATPQIGERCADIQLSAPEDGAGVVFNEDCDTAYVLPPVIGEAEVRHLSKSTNLNFCPGQLKVGKANERLADSLKSIADRIVTMIEGFTPLQREIERLRLTEAGLLADKEAAEEAYQSLLEREEIAINSLADIKGDYRLCASAIGVDKDPKEECQEEYTLFLEARKGLRVFLLEDLHPAQDAARSAKRKYRRVSRELEALTKSYSEGLEPVLSLHETLLSLNKSMQEVYSKYGKMPASAAQIVYRMQWDELLQKYRDLNPKYQNSLNFTKVPVSKANIYVQTKNQVPGMLWATLPGPGGSTVVAGPQPDLEGMEADPSLDRLAGEGTEPVRLEDQPTRNTVPFSNSVSGQMVLNLNGACPYFPQGVETVLDDDIKSLGAMLVANVAFTFEVAAKRGYTARYNLKNFASRVEKNSKSGGFFSSKHVHSIVEEKDSSDWFEINFDAAASEFQYSTEEQDRIAREAKIQLIERAMKNLASANYILKSVPPGLPHTPRYTGASLLAQRTSCGYWYCRVGSYTLHVLDSIFGSRTAVSNFKKSNDVWVSDKVNGVRMIERTHFLTFE